MIVRDDYRSLNKRGNRNKKNIDYYDHKQDVWSTDYSYRNRRVFHDRYGKSKYYKNGTKPKYCKRKLLSLYNNIFQDYFYNNQIPNFRDWLWQMEDEVENKIYRKLRHRLNKRDYTDYFSSEHARSPHIKRINKMSSFNPDDDSITTSPTPTFARAQQAECVPNSNPANNHIHHFTEEYYLSYITRHYDFSLTHNDLLSIEKNHIPIVVDMISKYFESVDEKLRLQHIELIDHNIYKNEYFIFSFSKVFIKAKLHTHTDPKTVFTTELVAFSKYPDNPKLAKMISDVSSMIYRSLREQDLDINIRLIDLNTEPENEMVFTRIFGNSNSTATRGITIKDMKITEEFYPYLDVELLKSEYLLSNNRLLLLYGENGSGKTKLSNLLALHLQENSYEIVIVSGSDIQYESIITKMESIVFEKTENCNNVCLIIDDLDPKYLNRDHGNMVNTFFTKLLTIVDGNIDCDLKVIITTNHILREDQDDPLYRNGRLFDSIYVRYLNKDEAKAILKSNKVDAKTIKNFLDKQTEIVKQADVADVIHNKKKGITKSYYKDKEIETNIIRKRVGFRE